MSKCYGFHAIDSGKQRKSGRGRETERDCVTAKNWFNPTFCVSFHQMCFGCWHCSRATHKTLILYHCRGYVDLSCYRYWCHCYCFSCLRLHKHLHRPKIRYTKIYWIGFTDATLVSNSFQCVSVNEWVRERESACITNGQQRNYLILTLKSIFIDFPMSMLTMLSLCLGNAILCFAVQQQQLHSPDSHYQHWIIEIHA